MSRELEEELKERLGWKKLERSTRSISGSCINNGFCYNTDYEQSVFIKTNATQHAPIMFEGELESLKHIQATKTVQVPNPITVLHNYDRTNSSAIVMEYFNLASLTSEESASMLGQHLAQLHDYNKKVIRYNEKARTWIGGKAPSSKTILEAKKENLKVISQHQDQIENNSHNYEEEIDKTDDDGEDELQFTKHSLRLTATSGLTDNYSQNLNNTDSSCAIKFVPEPNTEEINRFGFDLPTSCGLIPQVNDWHDEWIPFFARNRLDKEIRAILSDRGDRELSEQWSSLQLKVGKFFIDLENEEDKIVPALLHGDLWSGNVAQLQTASKQPVIYDPCSFYGHSEYDFGIARMFGGLPRVFEQAYFQMLPKNKFFEKRNKLYQLFHHLNHWDHFGSGYRSSSLRLIKELNNLV